MSRPEAFWVGCQRRQETRVGRLLAFQALRVQLVGEFLQLVFDAGSRLLEGASQEAGLISGDVEGNGSAVPLGFSSAIGSLVSSWSGDPLVSQARRVAAFSCLTRG